MISSSVSITGPSNTNKNTEIAMSDVESDKSTDRDALVIAGPVTGAERIASLDILRGVAILGILVMNIYAFAMPFMAYFNPLVMGGTDPLNLGTWFFTHFFFDQKFLSIFAMLFGAGVILLTGRARSSGPKYGRIYYRRQLWLLLLGAIHGYLIWFGDILFVYAAIGMLAYLFRNRTPRTLVIIACLLLPVALGFSYGNAIYVDRTKARVAEITELRDAGETLTPEQEKVLEDWEATRVFMSPTAEDLQKDVATHKGSYMDILEHRVPFVATMQVFMVFFFGIWRVTALMLIGMALMKLGILSAERSADFYRKLMVGGYALGLPLTVFSGIDLHAHDFNPGYVFRVGGITNYFGSIIVALGHVGTVMLIIRTGFVRRLMQRFAAVGRMALTNYLMHSVILTSVFYGYGLGLYSEIPRFWQMGFVVVVIALQLYLCPWWLSRYRFGPVEWLWRSLTYWRRQPMRQG